MVSWETELCNNKVYLYLGLGDKLSSNVSWPTLNCGNDDTNVDDGPSTDESANQNVTEEKSPDLSLNVSENKMAGSPVKVGLIFLQLTVEENHFVRMRNLFPQVVTFLVVEEIASATSPSDSNNSADSAPESSANDLELSETKR